MGSVALEGQNDQAERYHDPGSREMAQDLSENCEQHQHHKEEQSVKSIRPRYVTRHTYRAGQHQICRSQQGRDQGVQGRRQLAPALLSQRYANAAHKQYERHPQEGSADSDKHRFGGCERLPDRLTESPCSKLRHHE